MMIDHVLFAALERDIKCWFTEVTSKVKLNSIFWRCSKNCGVYIQRIFFNIDDENADGDVHNITYITKSLASNVIEILQKYSLNHLGNQPNLYLYGHQTINFADNRKILLSTIKYIKETRRFST